MKLIDGKEIKEKTVLLYRGYGDCRPSFVIVEKVRPNSIRVKTVFNKYKTLITPEYLTLAPNQRFHKKFFTSYFLNYDSKDFLNSRNFFSRVFSFNKNLYTGTEIFHQHHLWPK